MSINFTSNNNNNNDFDAVNSVDNKVNKKYNFFASYGFVWLVMLIISAVALTVLFNSSASNKTSGGILVADSALIVEDLTKDNPIVGQNKVSDLLQESNTANSTADVPFNGVDLAEDFPDVNTTKTTKINPVEEKSYQNPTDTEITKLLKADTTNTANNTTNKPATTQAQPTTKPKQTNSVATSTTKANPATSKPQTKNTTATQKPVAVVDVWMVSVYSSPNANSLIKTAQNLQGKSSNLLGKANFYSVATVVNNNKTFRLLVANNLAYYANKQQASNYCANLKQAKVDCFVVKVKNNDLFNNKLSVN